MRRQLVNILLALVVTAANAYVRPEVLTVEMMETPLGLEEKMPRFSWKLSTDEKDVMQKSYRILVSSSAEKLAADNGDVWDSGTVKSRQSLLVPFEGSELQPMTRYWWKVQTVSESGSTEWSIPSYWQTGIYEGESEWGAEWIGGEMYGDDRTKAIPARYLRKEFVTDASQIRHAVLYIAGLGMYEPWLNGHRVSENVMLQAPTRYDKLVLYNAHDVTSDIRSGKPNTLGVVLGNGRFCPERMPSARWFGFPRLFARLEIEYADGHRQTVVSDSTWSVTNQGPIRANSEYDGEIYDRRMAMDGWNCNGFDESHWTKANLTGGPGGRLKYQLNPGIAVKEGVLAKSVTEIHPGTYVIDMGENMVGTLNIKIRGMQQRGDSIKVRFAETLNPDGSLYITNLRTAKPCDIYICGATGEEIWHPTFTYHGFRYAEITGLSYPPSPNEFIGWVIYDDMPQTGTFSCSDSVMNMVYDNAIRGIRSNYRGFPTDCPQRDERLPWLGDRTTGMYGEAFPFGNYGLYRKWLDDIESCQRKGGGIPDICPDYWDVYSDNMTWPLAYLTTADMLESQYGDNRPIKDHYASMKAWIERMKNRYMKDWVIERDEYGDWCLPPESLELIHSSDSARITPKPILATSHLFYALNLMQRFAEIAGHSEDKEQYAVEADSVRCAFNRRFFNQKGGFYGNNTVTGNLIALRFGMTPVEERERVVGHIADKIKKEYDSHVCVGVIGIQHLMRGLTENGHGDLAYTIASNRTYPSWGYMAEQGATTIWELWNGNTAAPDMNSGNHVMLLGDLLIWEYRMLAGINPMEKGFGKIRLCPVIPDGMSHASATYESVYGRIASSWRIAGGKLEWTFTIPPNTKAEVCLPASSGSYVTKQYGSGTYKLTSTL